MRSIGVQALGAAFCALVSFLLVVFLGRLLGPSSFGTYASLLSLAIVGLIFVEGGWPTLLYREGVGAEAAPQLLILVGHAVAHIIAASLALGALGWIIGGQLANGIVAGMICMGCVALTNLISARLRAGGAFAREAIWQSGARTISASMIVAAVLFVGTAPTSIFLAWALGLAAAILFWGRHWLTSPSWRNLSSGYRLALPFIVLDGTLVFLLRGDVALLGAMGVSRETLSFYAACTRFTEVGVLLFAPVSNVLLRKLRLEAGTPSAFRRTTQSGAIAAVALGLAAVVGSWMFGAELVVAVFGEAYRPAGALLPYVASVLPLALLNLLFAQTLLARNRERELARSLVVACMLLAPLMFIGVRLDGARGAAVGVVLVHAILLLSMRNTCRNESPIACVSQ